MKGYTERLRANKRKLITVELPEELWVKMNSFAQANHQPLSAHVREVVAAFHAADPHTGELLP